MAKLELIRPNPEPGVIELLKTALDEAEKGGICGIAIALTYTDGRTANAYSLDRAMSLIGELRVLERDIVDSSIDLRRHEAGDYY